MVTTIQELQNYLLTSTPKDFKKKYTKNWGLDNVKKFLQFINNPQEKQPTIHVSGTSGKGSTSYFTAKLLETQGFKVGLHVSPFVVDFCESFQINSQLPDQKQLLKSFNKFVLEYQKFDTKLTYHELKTCFAYYFFNSQEVDFVVMETGMGGTFDSTNTVIRSDKICLINQIGYDHQEFLGSRISQIADEETGIINPGNTVVFVNQQYKTSTKIITKKARQNKARLYQVIDGAGEGFKSQQDLATNGDTVVVSINNFKNHNNKPPVILNLFQDLKTSTVSKIQTTLNGTTFDYRFDEYSFPNLITKNLGDFQAKNASLAITGMILASQIHKFKLDQKAIYKGLNQTIFPARMQLVDSRLLDSKILNNHKIIIDGAHNDQKIEALVNNLQQIFANKKFTILCGFSGHRDPKPMLKKLTKIADKIILTQFTNDGLKTVGKSAIANAILEKSLQQLGFKNYVSFENLQDSLDYFKNNTTKIGLITGSFYLCGEVMKNTRS